MKKLKEEVESLITAHDEAGDFFEQPAMAQDASILLGVATDANLSRELGPYKIIERLGAGGMGEVYLAQDTRLGRPVALKLLPDYFASDDARLRRFQSEARAASALNHPNILTIHEVGETDGVHFIVTEFIDGQTIRELIRSHELALEEILDSVEQVASALSAAHAAGIVHRDIKPENIMRRSDGLVKILDFGIAKLMETETSDETTGMRTHTEAGLVIGTASYMSPEQARALAVDERTDIWSLGVVLYEMLSRCLPFSGATRMDTMVAILDREPAPLSQHYSPQLQVIVSRCLRKEVSDRYGTIGELLVDLKSVREHLSTPVSQTNPTLVHQRSSLGRFLWPILAVAVLAISAVTGTILYRRSVVSQQPGVSTTSEAKIQTTKLYSEMTEAERLDFVFTQGQRISTMMGDRPGRFPEAAARSIKPKVDRYVNQNSQSKDRNHEGLSAIYERAQPYVPLIARSFAARKVPIIIGIYLPVIESAYRDCSESPLGSKGLFQFLPGTAAIYGVAAQDMCDAEKMTPAAAQYIADHMAELGEDSESVTLVLLSYNRGAESVRQSLRQLRGTENYERNFWALLANSEAMDDNFRRESAGYVPQFFAAAIIGENPAVFGLKTPPLSTLAGR